jgi:ubiquitin carboxyl-terminal hydrolase 5/13
MRKIGDGLLSGRYSEKKEEGNRNGKWQEGLKPSGLKALIGKGHEEFASMRQQGLSDVYLSCPSG